MGLPKVYQKSLRENTWKLNSNHKMNLKADSLTRPRTEITSLIRVKQYVLSICCVCILGDFSWKQWKGIIFSVIYQAWNSLWEQWMHAQISMTEGQVLHLRPIIFDSRKTKKKKSFSVNNDQMSEIKQKNMRIINSIPFTFQHDITPTDTLFYSFLCILFNLFSIP